MGETIQRKAVRELVEKGGEEAAGVPNVVWIMGRCIKVLENGELDEL